MKKIILLLFISITLLVASIDINKASKLDFMQIKGIGAKKAQSIIDYRLQHGKFKSVNDLKNIKGIGASIVNNVKNGTKNSKRASAKKRTSTQKSSSVEKKTTQKNSSVKSKNKTKVKKSTKKKSKKSSKKKKSKSSSKK